MKPQNKDKSLFCTDYFCTVAIVKMGCYCKLVIVLPGKEKMYQLKTLKKGLVALELYIHIGCHLNTKWNFSATFYPLKLKLWFF